MSELILDGKSGYGRGCENINQNGFYEFCVGGFTLSRPGLDLALRVPEKRRKISLRKRAYSLKKVLFRCLKEYLRTSRSPQ